MSTATSPVITLIDETTSVFRDVESIDLSFSEFLHLERPADSGDAGETSTSMQQSTTTIATPEHNPFSILKWDGESDPGNPRNWSKKMRWIVTIVVSLYTFISPVASSISSPSLPAISAELGIEKGSILENMVLSIFVLAYAFGPLFWGPLSEIYGRLTILQVSNLWFLFFNTLCGIAKTPLQLLVFRFLSGFGGAAPQSIGSAIVGDMFSPEDRGMAMGMYSIAPLVGPSTGPFLGGFIAENTTWKWVFFSVSIADALLQVIGFVYLRETYAPEILRRRARKAMKQMKDEEKNEKDHHEFVQERHWTSVLSKGITRPLRFLATEPIVQVFALYMAVLYGVLYLTLTRLVVVFTDEYHQPLGIAGIHYLAIALGSTVGGQAGSRALRHFYVKLKATNGGVGTPEMRLPLLMVSATTLPIGLLMYGWTAQARLFWLLPDIGVFIYSIGIGGNWTCIQTYLVDNYSIYGASAIAGVSSFRAFAGFGFPLAQEKLYGTLGDGWGNSVLALVCLVIGCPAPFVFYKYGPKLRALSKAASVEQ